MYVPSDRGGLGANDIGNHLVSFGADKFSLKHIIICDILNILLLFTLSPHVLH
jgi:hypothetical protein